MHVLWNPEKRALTVQSILKFRVNVDVACKPFKCFTFLSTHLRSLLTMPLIKVSPGMASAGVCSSVANAFRNPPFIVQKTCRFFSSVAQFIMQKTGRFFGSLAQFIMQKPGRFFGSLAQCILQKPGRFFGSLAQCIVPKNVYFIAPLHNALCNFMKGLPKRRSLG